MLSDFQRAKLERRFELLDADDSGTLHLEELVTWFNAYGVCADDAERAFRAVDRNGDGLLDANEVQKAIREFYTSDDPQAPGNLIFGPLPVPAVVKSDGHGASMKTASPKHAAKKPSAMKPSATIPAKR